MLKVVYAVLLGLIGAGLVHIAVLLLIPSFSSNDAWSRMAAVAGPYQAIPLKAETGGNPVVKSVDPLFLAAACRFDLRDGFVHLSADGAVPFWSVSVYNRAGDNIYSLNDRVSDKRRLDLVVITHAELVELRKNPAESNASSVFIESTADEGIVVVRAFAPDETWLGTVSSFLGGMTCRLQAS
jgi:uncharacterized membrane protein